MIQVDKEVHVLRVTGSSGYLMSNIKWLHKNKDKIGPAIGAVNEMTARDIEFRSYLRNIIGLSPESSNWDSKVSEYWNNISEHIPETGKILKIGFKYDVSSVKDEAAKAVLKKLEITTDKALLEYVEGTDSKPANVSEEEKYKFGTPVNPADYILWRYCLVYSHVANKEEDIAKAPKKIRFYLYDPTVAKKDARSKAEKSLKATSKIMAMSSDVSKITFILKAMNIPGVDAMDDFDRLIKLKSLAEANPDGFFEVEKDKDIQVKALIFDALNKNLLRKLPNTEIIVTNEGDTIGNSMIEAIAYFKDAKNKTTLSTIEAQLKNLPKA